MKELHTIEAALLRTARRRRLSQGLRGMWTALFYTSIVWLLVLATYKFVPLPASALVIAGIAGFVAIGVGALAGGWRRISIAETARWVDLKQNLKERLSTALEVASAQSDTEWQQLVVHDAAEHAHGLDPRRLLPLHLPGVARWVLVLLAVGAGLCFVPEYRSRDFRQKQADAAAIKDTGRQLVTAARRTIENKPPVLEPTVKAIEKVEELGQHLAKASLTKADALKDISNVREKLEKEARALNKEAVKPLEKAAREPNSGGSQTPESLQKQIDALQKSMGAAAGNDPAKLDQFKQDLAKAQQAAANLPDKNTPEGKAAREQLSKMMNDLAQKMRDAGMSMENVEDALKALQAGSIDQMVKDMNIEASDLEKLSETAKQLQAMQQQAAQQMGKDLGEQLKNGQTAAAQKTLQKMIDQLKTSQLNKEQLDQVLAEVSKAVGPAGEYGKVADHLKNAAKQMQEAQKPGTSASQQGQCKAGAANSLAEASKELEKLAQQMADAEQLAQTMAMLERAQEAIASGQGWCQGAKKGYGWKDGGKGLRPGGVGTWTDDETGWTYYPKNVPQDPVDNSGIKRPDMAPRGLTERDATLNEKLKPTKVKGQLTPGGQMPSVTLKGVSIKGQSRVQFEESASAAQTEAQSALNQDQVPRAYRGAVKDYFNDLKK